MTAEGLYIYSVFTSSEDDIKRRHLLVMAQPYPQHNINDKLIGLLSITTHLDQTVILREIRLRFDIKFLVLSCANLRSAWITTETLVNSEMEEYFLASFSEIILV